MNTAFQRRNAAAFRAGQSARDHALPPGDDGREAYITAQAGLLLAGQDADQVPFCCDHPVASSGFAEAASEALLDADGDDYPLLRLVLAVRAGDHALAARLVLHFDAALCHTAESLITRALERAA